MFVADYHRYVATELPLRYRKLVAKTSRCRKVVAGLWIAALISCIAPLPTKPDWIYYRYSVEQKMCGLHWEYPSYCVITALYIPILSGTVLVFTGLRIRATLRDRHSVPTSLPAPNSTVRRNYMYTVGGRRTLKILTYTSAAYFALWSPYTFVVLSQSFFSWFKAPPGVEFAVMWLANSNSALNVFIYSSTNKQFRRHCVLLASRLCCSRSPARSFSERPNPRPLSLGRSQSPRSVPAITLPTVSLQAVEVNVTDTLTVTSSVVRGDVRDDVGEPEVQTLPRSCQFLTVDNMRQALSIDTLASWKDHSVADSSV